MNHRYQPHYCEENVWWLLHEIGPEHGFAVFISNAGRQVAFWQQRAAPEDHPLVWDYHVIAIETKGPARVWDLDSRLPLPVALELYLTETFRPLPASADHLGPRFRVIAATTFLARFATDRSHMRSPEGGYLEPPPPWPPPGGPGSNVMRLSDMTDGIFGDVTDLPGLRLRFATGEPSGARRL